MSDSNRRGSDNRSPIIVSIGASAGGVQALQILFDALPDGTGASFVVIVHLDPQTHSDLASILASRTGMPVVQVMAREEIKPNHVYVIPPDRQLEIADHEISAVEFQRPRGQRTAIDLFFRSHAERIGDGFAVILTGAGSDGAIGVRAVKEAGGIVLVQDPEEAEHASMPRSAVVTGVADFILPLRGLAAKLVELIAEKQRTAETIEIDQELLGRVFAQMSMRTGHDFSKYRRSTVLRRIARRMHVTRSGNFQAYYEFLRTNVDEAQALLNDMLISVTTFFRDAEVFGLLKATIMPQLFEGKGPNDSIRVWVPGCATGEEAYTIAILLIEQARQHEIRPPIQVFGSDIDTRALAIAREGQYPTAIEADVNEERLRRFFIRGEDHYRVRQELRDMVLFANHSLLKDPPFSRVDLISCRNVLIYLDQDVQEQVLTTLYYALNAGGYLLLGPSETADHRQGLFRVVDQKTRLYQSTARPAGSAQVLPRLLRTEGGRKPAVPRQITPSVAMREVAAHRRALEQTSPPSILVDASHQVLHLSENAGRYTQPVSGPLTGDVVDLVRPEFRAELLAALHRAFDQQCSTLSLPILVNFNGAPHRVDLQVKPVPPQEGAEGTALVLFIEGEAVDSSLTSRNVQQVTDETVRRLTEELELTQARMRTLREESSAANEELRAANEELQSMNEEYRSTAEELETSKEELQSINEELTTVNTELKQKLEAVSRANSDLQNLMAVTDVGTLFLDPGLRIRRFTDRVTDLFNITPADEGRPITDFAQRLEYDDLAKDARAVLDDLTPIRREVHGRNNGWYDVRLRPYRTIEDKIDGVVITFSDVTDRHRTEEALRECERKLQQTTS
jgi:two-component system, chemotaxis family, CheB/CheR fusion protein